MCRLIPSTVRSRSRSEQAEGSIKLVGRGLLATYDEEEGTLLWSLAQLVEYSSREEHQTESVAQIEQREGK